MTWDELRHEWESGSDTLLCHTSGSTGRPSEIRLPREQVKKSALRTISFFSIDKDSHLRSCISPDFIGGKMMLIRSLAAGCRFSWETPTNHPLDGYDGPAISLLSVVPSQLNHLLDHQDSLPEIGDILVGGAPLSPAQRRRVADSSLRVWESYGMTETASHIALRRVVVPQPGFLPLPGIEVAETDGRLEISIEGWKRLLTNDVPRFSPDGSFSIIGRADNTIISGGMKIHPEEVEAKLAALLPFPFMITSRPDPKWGEAVTLVADNTEISDSHILDVCRRTLLKHEVPKIILRDEINLTPNGKVKRR